jgi:tetratricopeptide (TPR) repeat protein
MKSIQNTTGRLLIAFSFFVAISASAQINHPDETLLRQKAAAYTFANKLDSALYFAKKLISAYPNTENLVLLGSVYELKKDLAMADLYYGKALESAGSEIFKLYADLAQVQYRRGSTTKAIEYANRSLQINAQQPSLHFLLGSIYQATDNIDSANRHFELAYRQDDHDTGYAKKMYSVYYRQGQLDQAVPILEKLVTENPSDHASRLSLANVLVELDQYDKAFPLVEHPKGDSIDRDYFILATCYLNLGDTTNAILSIQKAISFSKKPEPVYYELLVQVYAATGRFGNMLEAMKTASTAGLNNYSQWLQSYQQKLDTIAVLYRSIGSGDPASVLLNLGKLYFSIRDYKNSLKVLTDYLTVGGPANDQVFALLAVACMNLKRNEEARQYIEHAIQLSPSNEDYQQVLTLIHYRLKDYSSVVGSVNKLRLSTTGKPAGISDIDRYLLFKSYHALGSLSEAAQYHRAFQQGGRQ